MRTTPIIYAAFCALVIFSNQALAQNTGEYRFGKSTIPKARQKIQG